ncbi:MAG: SAM hydroxide adenosyltransferase [Candidatus Beckwithbacteria bacterium]
MTPSPLIHIVADYGTGDLAFAEVIQRFHTLLPQAKVLATSTPPFSTLNTGFIIAQLAIYNPSRQLFIFSNTAPRKDDSQKRSDNEGEKFKYALLNNGVEICGVDAGYCFSFIKPFIKKFYLVNVANKGSQFRSRDYYPQAAVGILTNKKKQFLGEKLSTENIPDLPPDRIMHIDSYGNIKTTIRKSSVNLTPGQKIRVVINHIFQTGIYANGNFCVKSGDLAFAPGSSGGADSFMEIFLRSGNASRFFNNPPIETKIKIETL